MSTTLKAVAALAVLTALGACAQPQEEEVVIVEPVVVEQPMSKY